MKKTYLDTRQKLLSREIFVSPDLYVQELRAIFGHNWLFVGHQDQIKLPGDFFLSRMGESSVIVNRDDDGKVHVFLNTCRHRGMRVCRYDEGNSREFNCPYHGWTYGNDGQLVGVPQFRESYESRLNKSEWGLIEAPKVHNYRGTLWASWDSDVPPFEVWLSDMHHFLGDEFLALPDGTDGEWECIGGIMKWTIPCNWKWGAENFIGDNYHNVSHASVDVVELSPSGRKGRHQTDVVMEAVVPTSTGKKVRLETDDVPNRGRLINISLDKWGHGARGMLWDDDYPYVSQWGRYPLVDQYFREQYERRQKLLGKRSRFQGHGGTIFPNMSWSDNRRSIAVWHPNGVNSTEVWRWTFVPKDAPNEVKEVMRHYAMTYQGPSGLTEQDDMENWNYAHEGCMSPQSWDYPFNYSLGKSPDESLLAEWGLKESTLAEGISELNQVGYLKHWNDRICGTNDPSDRTE